MTDRVKQAIFDVLGSCFGTPGRLPGITVADVFAGGGSFGLEALSRGAARVCFVDRDLDAISAIKRNLSALGAGPEAVIVAADAWRCAVRPPEGFCPLDLVFLDPPFRDSQDTTATSKVASLLRRLGAGTTTGPGTQIVFRHSRRVSVPDNIGVHWRVRDRREYGINAITYLDRGGPDRIEAPMRISTIESGEGNEVV